MAITNGTKNEPALVEATQKKMRKIIVDLKMVQLLVAETMNKSDTRHYSILKERLADAGDIIDVAVQRCEKLMTTGGAEWTYIDLSKLKSDANGDINKANQFVSLIKALS